MPCSSTHRVLAHCNAWPDRTLTCSYALAMAQYYHHQIEHHTTDYRQGLTCRAGTAGRQGGKKSKKRRLQAEAAAFTQSSAVPAGQVRALELGRQEAALQLLTFLIRVRPCLLTAILVSDQLAVLIHAAGGLDVVRCCQGWFPSL